MHLKIYIKLNAILSHYRRCR